MIVLRSSPSEHIYPRRIEKHMIIRLPVSAYHVFGNIRVKNKLLRNFAALITSMLTCSTQKMYDMTSTEFEYNVNAVQHDIQSSRIAVCSETESPSFGEAVCTENCYDTLTVDKLNVSTDETYTRLNFVYAAKCAGDSVALITHVIDAAGNERDVELSRLTYSVSTGNVYKYYVHFTIPWTVNITRYLYDVLTWTKNYALIDISGNEFKPAIGSIFCVKPLIMLGSGTDANAVTNVRVNAVKTLEPTVLVNITDTDATIIFYALIAARETIEFTEAALVLQMLDDAGNERYATIARNALTTATTIAEGQVYAIEFIFYMA